MERSILGDVRGDDLAQGVDAVGHRFECAWKREILEDPAARQQKCAREAVDATGVGAPAADDVAPDVHPERPRALRARNVNRRVSA